MPEPILLKIIGALGNETSGNKAKASLGRTCKDLLHARFVDAGDVSAAGWTFDVCLGGWGGTDASLQLFRRCLELHPNNFSKTITYNGISSITPFDLPYGRLGSLTCLWLHCTTIHLPSLRCIGHQLQRLRLEDEVILRTGALPGAQSDIFAAGWGGLRHLHLHGVCIDAAIGAVHLPSLEQLCMLDVKVGDPEGTEYIFVDTFAAGCPSCTVVDYAQPLPVLPAAGLLCRDFLRLQELTLHLGTYQQVSECDLPALPTTVTSLRLCYQDLHTQLELAAAWVKSGARLQKLLLEASAPRDSDTDAGDEQQQQRLMAGQCAAVCAQLHGITRMRLWEYYGTMSVLNAILTAMPDLKHILLDVVEGDLCADTPISCSGLERLHLRDELECNCETLRLSLSHCCSLRSFALTGPQSGRGKLVEVRITGHDPAASIVHSAEVWYDDDFECTSTRLSITLGEGRAECRWHEAACVRFKCEDSGEGKDAVWVAQPLAQC